MTRIIAGLAKSVLLATPGGTQTRPTSDRVREALFGSLDARAAVLGARTLDLYAGTGALGLEALSRGAHQVTLVDQSAQAVSACRSNAQRVIRAAGLTPDTVRVVTSTAATFLRTQPSSYDLAFLDPPYALPGEELSSVLITLLPQLAPDAVVAVERSRRSPSPAWPAGYTPLSTRHYGETSIYLATVGEEA